MEHESYDIDITNIKNSDKICFEYAQDPPTEEDNWFEASDNLYYKLSPITEALATCSDFVHLTQIKPSNIMEWYYRLDALYDAGIGFLYTDTREGEIPIRLNIHDLKDHIGLRLDTFPWESKKFDCTVRNIRMRNHLKELL